MKAIQEFPQRIGFHIGLRGAIFGIQVKEGIRFGFFRSQGVFGRTNIYTNLALVEIMSQFHVPSV